MASCCHDVISCKFRSITRTSNYYDNDYFHFFIFLLFWPQKGNNECLLVALVFSAGITVPYIVFSLCLFSVPFVMTGGLKFKEITHNAALCDVATTVLDVMGLPIPQEMTGQSLLAK